jgi:hypothetical protein
MRMRRTHLTLAAVATGALGWYPFRGPQVEEAEPSFPQPLRAEARADRRSLEIDAGQPPPYVVVFPEASGAVPSLESTQTVLWVRTETEETPPTAKPDQSDVPAPAEVTKPMPQAIGQTFDSESPPPLVAPTETSVGHPWFFWLRPAVAQINGPASSSHSSANPSVNPLETTVIEQAVSLFEQALQAAPTTDITTREYRRWWDAAAQRSDEHCRLILGFDRYNQLSADAAREAGLTHGTH